MGPGHSPGCGSDHQPAVLQPLPAKRCDLWVSGWPAEPSSPGRVHPPSQFLPSPESGDCFPKLELALVLCGEKDLNSIRLGFRALCLVHDGQNPYT